MIRNLDRVRNENLNGENVANLVENLSQFAELTGAPQGEATLDYETADCEPGDLVPVLKIGFRRVVRNRPVSDEAANAGE